MPSFRSHLSPKDQADGIRGGRSSRLRISLRPRRPRHNQGSSPSISPPFSEVTTARSRPTGNSNGPIRQSRRAQEAGQGRSHRLRLLFLRRQDKNVLEAFHTAAEKERDSYTFGYVDSADLAKAAGIKTFPSIVIYRSFDEPELHYPSSDPIEAAAIESFVKDASVPLIDQVGPENTLSGSTLSNSPSTQRPSTSRPSAIQYMGAPIKSSLQHPSAEPADTIKTFVPDFIDGKPRAQVSSTRSPAVITRCRVG
ncbi:hypothetical protein CF326_g7077 [Tilletia indica]|nr:hypothetical protein CF326_g7077 [Tilletia indica]